MNTKVETQGSAMDTIKLSIAVLMLIGGIGAYYFFADQSQLLRVVGLLAVVGIAVAIAMQTDKGRMTAAFFSDSRTEVRKVVWPTRKETTQITLMVIGVVIIVAIFLWMLDMFLGWAVRILTGMGG